MFHHQYENILRYVQKAPDDIHWTIDRTEFDQLIVLKKDSAPGPDGIPYSFYSCAERDWVRRFYSTPTNTCWSVPALFAESRTVSFPKSSDVDNNGRIVRSPEALRPLTLCNCDCKLLTSAICRGLNLVHHEMHTSFAEMYLLQANDGQHF